MSKGYQTSNGRSHDEGNSDIIIVIYKGIINNINSNKSIINQYILILYQLNH